MAKRKRSRRPSKQSQPAKPAPAPLPDRGFDYTNVEFRSVAEGRPAATLPPVMRLGELDGGSSALAWVALIVCLGGMVSVGDWGLTATAGLAVIAAWVSVGASALLWRGLAGTVLLAAVAAYPGSAMSSQVPELVTAALLIASVAGLLLSGDALRRLAGLETGTRIGPSLLGAGLACTGLGVIMACTGSLLMELAA